MQPYRRYDETTRDGDLVETLFKANPYIERQLYRLNSTDRATSAIPSAEEPRDIEAVISGRGLTAVMESPEDEIIARVDEERAARAA